MRQHGLGNPVFADDGDAAVDAQADVPAVTEAPPPPTELPPPPPPTEAPVIVEPTSVPTEAPTAIPTEAPTTVPTVEPTATPTPTTEPTLTLVVVDDTLACQPQGATSGHAHATIAYDCSLVAGSERTGTRIHAELTSTGLDGWQVQIVYRNASGALMETASVSTAEAMLGTTLSPGAQAAFQVTILTPGDVPFESAATVTLGTGIVTGTHPTPGFDGPQTSLGATAIPYPPNALTCETDSTDIMPGEIAETTCTYTVNGPSDGASVNAAFGSAPGKGWGLEIERISGGDPLPSALGETTTWSTGESLAMGSTFDLAMRVSAPLEAEPGQQATIAVAPDGMAGLATWTVTVAAAPLPSNETDGLSCDGPGEPQTGPMVTYTCTWTNTRPQADGRVLATADDFDAGWKVALESEAAGQASPLTGVAGAAPGGVEFDVIVYTPPGAAEMTAGSTTITATCGTPDNCTDGSATISTIAAQATGQTAEATLQCTPQAGFTITANGTASFNCTLTAQVPNVTWTAISGTVPAGWTPLINDSGNLKFTRSGNNWTFAQNQQNPQSLPLAFTLKLTAPCNVTPGNYPITIATAIRLSTTPVTGPALSFDVSASAVALAGGFTGSGPASFAPATVTGTSGATVTAGVTLDIVRAACSAGSVTVQVGGNTGNFTTADGDPNAIPLANLSVTGVSVTSGDNAFISETTPGGTITTPANVATVLADTTSNTYALNLGLSLAVPAGTATGTYTATLTVNFVSGGTAP